jgi:hypothetical protein
MNFNRNTARGVQILLAVVLAVAAFYIKNNARHAPADPHASPPAQTSSISELSRQRRSGAIVQASGSIIKSLPDDTEGARHQRFIVRLSDGGTVLVAHNIDLAPRARVQEGSAVSFCGEYLWNEQGGIVHWTHHDPARRHPDGWIRVGDKTYE